MKLETLRDLLVEELQDLYDAEHQIITALPKMSKAATDPKLKKGLDAHLEATREHVIRLEQVFKLLGEKAERKPCKAMQGIVKEGADMIKEKADADVKDAGLIAAAQRVEHYEIAAYGTARAYARHIGQEQVYELLTTTLEEEKRTDKKLTQLAVTGINVEAIR